MQRDRLYGFKRLVIKIGSALLIDKDGTFNKLWLKSIADEISRLVENGVEILVVSSGAVAIGCSVIDRKRSQMSLNELQAAAAMGQAQLVIEWQEALEKNNVKVAQILLTPGDTENRKRFLNSKNTLQALLKLDVIPIINENDTVATDELSYGDNDRLAARVAQMVMADGLILLSDVDGLYDKDPALTPKAKHIGSINSVTDEILKMAGSRESNYGSGGMLTKLHAAKIAMHAGCTTIISNGTQNKPISNLMDGGKCSIFKAKQSPGMIRKQWLSGFLDTSGTLSIDKGAKEALNQGGSLLPVGLTEVSGDFERGDVVILNDEIGNEIGKGVTTYSSVEASLIVGCQSEEILKKLGYQGKPEIIHRDDMVLF
jgi:glutamate 5-kinase|tara:strand:- start:13022 stop:14137 length:1116 start_codon:yes stop_codon:yes gene_type:complete